ncbi:MAG: superoxide dismutase family protein [Bryobacteraceae bacterium]
MKKLFSGVATAVLLLVAACAPSPETTTKEDTAAEEKGGQLMAAAKLQNAKGEQVGTATFTQVAADAPGVQATVSIQNMEAGDHGLHIHEVGQCDAPDFKSAGDHFNPTNKEHGEHNPKGAHAGDLGNITIANDGTGTAEVMLEEVTLGSGDNSLLRAGGTSVVFHAKPDDQKTNPSGNSGDRMACGVITR